MGSGPTRAAQAAARSRWDGKLTPEMWFFLSTLATSDQPMTRSQVGPLIAAGRTARRRCSALGLAKEARRETDNKVGWQITEHGRDALGKGED